MAFSNANNFVMHVGQMIDNSSSGLKSESAFQRLYERACHGASHKTEERFDPPKCHEETRIAVIKDIMSWVNNIDSDQRILWMSGPAGAGKSAIVQTVAETCEQDMLVASFFFSRTATTTGRNDGARLIASLAYQMVVTVPETRPFVLKVLQDNPAVLKHSMENQMKNLIIEPLKAAISETQAARKFPELVVLDGLDECHNPQIQVSIINTLAQAVSRHHVPLRLLIASRPELEIRKTFGSQALDPICYKLVLDEKYNPDKDIELYIQSEFNIIKRDRPSLLKGTWPSDRDILTLVRKSSGQFIYASTVMKYINNDHENPRKRLELIINITPSPENPYAQLDALYTHILSSYRHDYALVKRLFEALFVIKMPAKGDEDILRVNVMLVSLYDYGDFLCVENIEDLDTAVSDLHSILDVGGDTIRLYHASFSDFLTDRSRSGRFFIGIGDRDDTHERLCLTRIQKAYQESTTSIPLLYACATYFLLLDKSRPSSFALLRSSSPRQIIGTAIRHLILNPFEFFLEPALYSTFTYDEDDSDDEFLEYSLSMKAFTIRRIPRETHWDHMDLAFPRKGKRDICKYIQDAVNEYAIYYFQSNNDKPDRSKAYIRFIYSGLLQERGSHPRRFKLMNQSRRVNLDYDMTWLAEILECPLHGKEYFLSAENSEEIFRMIWEERRTMLIDATTEQALSSKYSDKNMSPIDYLGLPATLHYLLKRCNISSPFRDYLRVIFPDLKIYLMDILKHTDKLIVINNARAIYDLDPLEFNSDDDDTESDASTNHVDIRKQAYEEDMWSLLEFNFESLPRTSVPQYGRYYHCSYNQWRMSRLQKWWQTWDIQFHPQRWFKSK